jgi:regulator of replication initiation timing
MVLSKKEHDEDMGTAVTLSQVQDLARENAALREERDQLRQQLAALEHAEADDEGHPADVSFSRWPGILLSGTVPYRNGQTHGP